MFVVDTNVLLYAADESCPESQPARRLLEGWRTQSAPWYVTWSILYEFMRVATHARVFKKPWSAHKVTKFLETLVDCENLQVLSATHRHIEVLVQTVEEVRGIAGNRAHDLHIAVLMREHGISRLVTRDHGFDRYPFLDVIDPFESGDTLVVRERAAKPYGTAVTRSRWPQRRLERSRTAR